MTRMLGAVVIAIAAMVGGCTVAVDSKRVGSPIEGSTEKVTSLKVYFDPRPPAQGTIQSISRGIAVPASIYAPEARASWAQFEQILSTGFRDRFPELARPYGLTVSPAGLNGLYLRVTSMQTTCTGSCATRVHVGGGIRDMGGKGKVIWMVDSSVGQSIKKISPEMFDALAHELLEAMRKDGIIGK